jgi:CsoR family transcriptional regulator, copper-sensing transcriptional repressor
MMARPEQPTGSCINSAKIAELRVRLNRVEGHVRGVKRMLDSKEDCQGVLIQVSAIRAALNQFTIEVVQCCLDSTAAECAASGDKKALRLLKNMVANILNS